MLILTLVGCTKTVTKIVKVDSFCTGKYETLWLEDKDFVVLGELYLNESYSPTISKYANYHTLNAKEFNRCQNLVKDQKKD